MDGNNQPVVGWGNADPAASPMPPAAPITVTAPAPESPEPTPAPVPTPTVMADPAPMPPVMPTPAFSRHHMGPPAPQAPQVPPAAPAEAASVAPLETPALPAAAGQSTPVVRVLSTHGLEYFMFSVALWFSAFSLGGIILSLVNGGTSFDVLSFPTAALVVSAAVLAWLFLRIKKAELLNPALRLDSSKRRVSQMTQIGSFLISFGTVIGIVYTILTAIAGSSDISIGKVLANLVVVLAIAGGIFIYYWSDEHGRR